QAGHLALAVPIAPAQADQQHVLIAEPGQPIPGRLAELVIPAILGRGRQGQLALEDVILGQRLQVLFPAQVGEDLVLEHPDQPGAVDRRGGTGGASSPPPPRPAGSPRSPAPPLPGAPGCAVAAGPPGGAANRPARSRSGWPSGQTAAPRPGTGAPGRQRPKTG